MRSASLQQSFLTLVNLPGFAKYRKTFIHDIKNLAHTFNHDNLFNSVVFDWDGKLNWMPNLVPNLVKTSPLKIQIPDFVPGVIIPLDPSTSEFIKKAALLISTHENFGSQMCVRYQIYNDDKYHYAHATPSKISGVLETVTGMSV